MTQFPDNNAGTPAAPGIERRYTMRRHNLVVGIVCTVFFLCLAVGSTAFAYCDVDSSVRCPLAAWIFGAFWSCWTLAGAWHILDYFRYSLSINEDAIVHIGLLGTSIINRDDVRQIRWRRFPSGGSIAVRSSGERITIDLDNFSPEQRTELIAFFHGTFADSVQQGWSRFADRFFTGVPQRPGQRNWALYFLYVTAIVGVMLQLWPAFRCGR